MIAAIQVDVEPLGKFQQDWRPDEPRRLDPVFVERTSLRDALAARRGLNPQNILSQVELIEPTFQVRPLQGSILPSQHPFGRKCPWCILLPTLFPSHALHPLPSRCGVHPSACLSYRGIS